MPFDPTRCRIPTVYCGHGPVPGPKPDKRYTGHGSRTECLRQGFGAGKYSEINQRLPANSLQRIKYVGPVHEANFRNRGIESTTQLLNRVRAMTRAEIATMLRATLTRGRGRGLDGKAYNMVLLYCHRNGVDGLPECRRL